MLQDPQIRNLVTPLARAMLLAVSFYGLVALFLGWGMNMELLVRHRPSQTALVPSTAAAFVLLPQALIAASVMNRPLTLILAAGTVLIVVTSMLTQIPQLADVRRFSPVELDPREYMAISSAVGLILGTVAALRLLKRDLFTVTSIGVFGASVSFCIFLLKFGGLNLISDLPVFRGMSLQAAFLFCLLFLAMCLMRTEDTED